MNILLTTFNNWQVLPELVAFVAAGKYGLYRNQYVDHDRARLDEIEKNRKEYHIEEPHEMWLICTSGVGPEHVAKWERWHAAHPFIPYRCFQFSGLEDINTLQDSRRMREFILRITCMAHVRTGNEGKLFISLAGGRKTMSSDMQYAAGFFGCNALIHVAASKPIADENIFFDETKTFPGFDVVPFVTDRYAPHPASRSISHEKFALSKPPINGVTEIECTTTSLLTKIEELYNTSGNFYVNYNNTQNQDYRSNFTVLFSLSPSIFRNMANRRIKHGTSYAEVEGFLMALPKTELHCHLGGVLYPKQIIEVARSWDKDVQAWIGRSRSLADFHESCTTAAATGNLEVLPGVLCQQGIKEYYSANFGNEGIPRHIVSAVCVLAFSQNEDLFRKLVYGELLMEDRFSDIGINRYERLGDYQGSSLLQSRESIRMTVRMMCKNAIEDNVKYIEVRCSPHKYTAEGLDELEVYHLIEDTMRDFGDRLKSKIIIIASRHGGEEDIQRAVQLAGKIAAEPGSLLAGIDLAGDEAARRPGEVRTLFLPLLEKCMGVTIHAGETMPSQSIWEAVYHLSAERIGHGLTLIERQDLLKKVRDRRIGVELCPSSNMQIAGYRYAHANAVNDPEYPLKAFLENEIRVTVNTDNPGISLTSQSKEIYRAALLSKDGLNMFDILQLIKNGVSTSFLDHGEKKQLMYQFEEELLEIFKKGIF